MTLQTQQAAKVLRDLSGSLMLTADQREAFNFAITALDFPREAPRVVVTIEGGIDISPARVAQLFNVVVGDEPAAKPNIWAQRDYIPRADLPTGELRDGCLICPHCHTDGSAEGYRYVEDIQNHRDVSHIEADESGERRILVVDGHYETGEGYDDGYNARIECRKCLGEFFIPAEVDEIDWRRMDETAENFK